jgi:hypothetical protein
VYLWDTGLRAPAIPLPSDADDATRAAAAAITVNKRSSFSGAAAGLPATAAVPEVCLLLNPIVIGIGIGLGRDCHGCRVVLCTC